MCSTLRSELLPVMLDDVLTKYPVVRSLGQSTLCGWLMPRPILSDKVAKACQDKRSSLLLKSFINQTLKKVCNKKLFSEFYVNSLRGQMRKIRYMTLDLQTNLIKPLMLVSLLLQIFLSLLSFPQRDKLERLSLSVASTLI